MTASLKPTVVFFIYESPVCPGMTQCLFSFLSHHGAQCDWFHSTSQLEIFFFPLEEDWGAHNSRDFLYFWIKKKKKQHPKKLSNKVTWDKLQALDLVI